MVGQVFLLLHVENSVHVEHKTRKIGPPHAVLGWKMSGAGRGRTPSSTYAGFLNPNRLYFIVYSNSLQLLCGCQEYKLDLGTKLFKRPNSLKKLISSLGLSGKQNRQKAKEGV